MKKKYILGTTLLVTTSLSLTACSSNKDTHSNTKVSSTKVSKPAKPSIPSPDYKDAESAESALNNGDDLEGKTVRFKITRLEPASTFGFNLETGEHLNFVNPHNPKVKVGQTVQVKVTEVRTVAGSFVLDYTDLIKID